MSPQGTGTRRGWRSRRGQSLVEFALVLPMLIILLLGVADFGRVFAAGITLEAAARNAAEIAAQAYVQDMPPEPADPEYATFDFPAYYESLHATAADAACAETQVLPNTTYSMGVCTAEPLIAVCVHDDDPSDPTDATDADCSAMPHQGGTLAATLPDEPCPNLNGDGTPSAGTDPAWTPEQLGTTEGSRYVEVRLCYRFTTLFNIQDLRLPLGWNLSLGEIHLSRRAVFTIADY